LIAEDRKAEAAFEFFDDILGVPSSRACCNDLDCLDLPRHELNGICDRFTEEEIWTVIHSLPPDKEPGLDGFTDRFLQAAWLIIRVNLMNAFDAFWCVDMRKFHKVNDGILTLIPKTSIVVALKDYRHISLIHLVGEAV
jgi:hypothetical protein